MQSLGFCVGSDRYTANLRANDQWTILDVFGAVVGEIELPANPDATRTIAAMRERIITERGSRFDVGTPETLNLDLREDAGVDLRENEERRKRRTHVDTVRASKDRFYVVLSDGSEVPWEGWGSELAELTKGRA